jgi:hypothetical protein
VLSAPQKSAAPRAAAQPVIPPAPVREARAVAAAPPASVIRPEPVRVAVAAPPPASCKQTLPAAAARLERALAQIRKIDKRDADMCAAYRRDFFEVVRAREVTAQCKTGPERAHDLGRIDAAVEDINGAIAASCGA